MALPQDIPVLYAPGNVVLAARIVALTPELYASAMAAHWWNEACLLKDPTNPPIDRHWSWFDPIETQGLELSGVRIAAQTEDGQIQGAMVISTQGIPSAIEEGECLFVDQICTAPRNRTSLRKDGLIYLRGVGSGLLRWAVHLSAQHGCAGKLSLIASPEAEALYRGFGFVDLKLAPVVYEGIPYKSMELPLAVAATKLAE